MVGMETEEGYNNIVEEVSRRIVKNDLFVKPEKYIWKVREMGFLRVVIGLDGINIEKKAYRWFIKDFTRIAKPLYEIIRKNIKWNWEEKQ